MILENLPCPIVFAHRGASAHAPENTMAAFVLAVQLGAPAIELDAKLSQDGEVVVFHDTRLERTTNGTGRVNQTPLAGLRELDAGGYFSPKFSGEKIPTLEEVLVTIGRRLLINVELTNYTSPGDDLVDRVACLVKKMGLENDVILSSFLPQNLVRVRPLLPKTLLVLLHLGGVIGKLSDLLFSWYTPHDVTGYHYRNIRHSLIQKAHYQGRRVFVYTVNHSEQIQRLIALGIDGVITDDPIIGMRAVQGIIR